MIHLHRWDQPTTDNTIRERNFTCKNMWLSVARDTSKPVASWGRGRQEGTESTMLIPGARWKAKGDCFIYGQVSYTPSWDPKVVPVWNAVLSLSHWSRSKWHQLSTGLTADFWLTHAECACSTGPKRAVSLLRQLASSFLVISNSMTIIYIIFTWY